MHLLATGHGTKAIRLSPVHCIASNEGGKRLKRFKLGACLAHGIGGVAGRVAVRARRGTARNPNDVCPYTIVAYLAGGG
jgi:hypothetical protein